VQIGYIHEIGSADAEVPRQVRVRPFNAREAARGCKCCVEMSGQKTTLLGVSDRNGDGRREFTFGEFHTLRSVIIVSVSPCIAADTQRDIADHCYWSHDRSSSEFASQEKVFGDLGRFALTNAFSGYNVCLFAYGQTGAGK
jgi:hypothetical protein